jgi:hypothetical protein
MILFKKQLFDLEVKGQGPTKVIMVCNTLPFFIYLLSLKFIKYSKCPNHCLHLSADIVYLQWHELKKKIVLKVYFLFFKLPVIKLL